MTDPIATSGLHFVMYLTDDLPRARTFYEALFGLRPGAYDSEFFVEYDLADGTTFALAKSPQSPREMTGGAIFGVPDSEAAIARIESLDGKVLARIDGGEHCRTGWCVDTEGNAFGVHQRR